MPIESLRDIQRATVSAFDGGGGVPSLVPLPWDFWYHSRIGSNNTAANDMFLGVAVSSGTNNTAIPTAGLAGYNSHGVFLRSGTTANGGYRYQTSSTVSDYFGTISHKFRFQFMWRTSFIGRLVRGGYLDTTTSADSVDGAYFEINGDLCSAKTANNSTRTTNATTVTLSLDVAYTFDIEVNADGTSARFRVYEGNSNTPIMDVTNTANIPTTAARAFGAGVVATEASTTASDIGILYGVGIGTVEGFELATSGIPGPQGPPGVGGFANPMLSTGDIIYGGTGGVATRLAAGSDGNVLSLSSGVPVWGPISSFTGFTPSLNTSSPNNTVHAARLLVNTSSTNGDLVLTPKGSGALQMQLATNNTTGGNKRGVGAVDFQTERGDATNVASGDRSFAAGTSNTVSGQYAASVGTGNIASGQSSFTFGQGNTADGVASFSSGINSQATGDYSCTMGDGNQATSDMSIAMGKNSVSRNLRGAQALSSGVLGGNGGDAQIRCAHLGAFTSDSTYKPLTAAYGTADGTNQLDIPAGFSFAIVATVVAKQVSSSNTKAWEMKGLLRNIGGTITLVGTPVYTVIGDSGVGSWAVRFAADSTNQCCALEVSGADAASVYWSADVRAAEIQA